MTVLVVGEALVDLIADDDDPVRFTARPGGSPANVAVTLARLGTPVRFAGRLSGDGFGRLLRDHLAGNGVGLSAAVRATEPASLAVITMDPDRAAEYAFYVTGTADWQWRPGELPEDPGDDVLAVHSGSIALALPPGGDVIAGWLARQRGRRVVSLDPNVRPGLFGDPAVYRPRLEGWVARGDLVKVSADDLAWTHPGERPAAVAQRWAALPDGPALVVVTLGGAGSLAVAGGEVVTCPAREVPVVDTVGAGDAVTGALLDWLARRDRLTRQALAALTPAEAAEALAFAAEIAARTVSRPGADPPRRAELAPP